MKLLNILGLLLNLLGVLQMFYYSPRRTKEISFREEEELKSILERQDKDRRRIKAALLLLAAGFSLQLVYAILDHSMQ